MIEIAEQDDVCTLTLARPDKANALTRDMLVALTDAVLGTRAKALVLTGQGKVFSAGADLTAAKAGLGTDPAWEGLSSAIAAFSGFSIAALNGTLAGGAFGMALACDLRVAVPHAKFFYPVMRLGFLPQPSDPVRLSALIGPARTKLLLMGGAKVEAEEALAWGLIDRIVALDMLPEAVAEITTDIRGAEMAHIVGIKALCG